MGTRAATVKCSHCACDAMSTLGPRAPPPACPAVRLSVRASERERESEGDGGDDSTTI